ncbi:Ephrin type-B receptor 1 [Liparis tanakae]|uniref:Ephrin type-B receptor 1 n=1 Tax=Liparis tanakae TaxID=230148 RepID=A0A4Z2GC24_9TELE|nr:Ephrin type-B receptor 1 [Liparis tanakae]
MSEGSTPGSSSSLTMSWESRSVLSSAATSAQNFPARSKTSLSFPSRSSARCRISSHSERRRRRRVRTAGGERGGGGGRGLSLNRKRAYTKEAVYSDKLQHYSTGRGESITVSLEAPESNWL